MEQVVQDREAVAGAGQRVLLVANQTERGCRGLLEAIGAVPALGRQVHLHLTGTGPPSLDGFGSVAFLFHSYPNCETEVMAIAHEARRRGLRLVNPPKAIDNTVKSTQSAIWRRAGLPCAQGIPAASAEEMRAVLDRVRYPLILRFDRGHRQTGIFACGGKEAALTVLHKLRYPAVALRFVDTRPSWRKRDPASLFARYYHKKRAMVFPNAVHNNHVFFSSHPIVGGGTSTFQRAADGDRVPDLEEMIAADIAYSFSPPEAPELMQAAVRALGLDVATIDYSTFADGSIVLWEANPSFWLQDWRHATLGEERRLEERSPRYMKSLLAFLGELAGVAIPA